MSYIHGYDPVTLREVVNPRDCRDRLDELGDQRSLPALLERVWLLKVLDRLGDALEIADQTVRSFAARALPPRKSAPPAPSRPRGQAGHRSPRSRTSTAAKCTTTRETSTQLALTSSAHSSLARARQPPTTSSSRLFSRSTPPSAGGPRPARQSPADRPVAEAPLTLSSCPSCTAFATGPRPCSRCT